MSGHQHATLEDTVYFYFGANDTSGSGGDGATPLFDVREAGAAASAAPLLSGTPTLLTHANFPAGCYEVAVAATAANGFAANDTFGVFCTLAIDSQNPTGFAGSCTLGADAIVFPVWDRLLTGATHNITNSAGRKLRQLQEAGNIYGGRVHIDTIDGTAGTTTYENGTTDNAVILLASGKTIAAAVGGGLHDFHIINGSTILLAESTTNESYFGDNWILQLGGQDVAGAYFQGAKVSGVGTSTSEVHFEGCDVATASIQLGHFDFCSFDGTVTHTLAGDYNYHNCYSKVAGIGGPTFAKTAGQTVTVQFRNWSGSATLSGIEAGDVMTISGTELGAIVLNGAEGTVKVLGIYESLTDNRTGSPTLVLGAYEGSDVTDILADTGTTIPATIVTAQNDLDIITGATGVNLLTATQSTIDNINSGVGIIIQDTNELQLDWANGGRLDVILDARMAEASISTTGGAVDTVTTLTGHTAQTGDNFTLIGTAGAGLTDLGGMSTAMKAEIYAAAMQTQMTESYAADTVAPTAEQFHFMQWSALHEFSIAGTTLTSKKLDSTSSMTHTLDDATNPTSRTRAT